LNKTGWPGFYASAQDITIKESITFHATITLPQSTITNPNVTIFFPFSNTTGRMIIQSSQVFYIGSSITNSTLNISSPGLLWDRNGDLIDDTVDFAFGNAIVDHGHGTTNSSDIIIVEVVAYADDTPGLVAGNQLTTSATFTYATGNYTQNITMDIIEPFLAVTMTADKTLVQAGDIIYYTITIFHNASSTAGALLLSVQKTLNQNLMLIESNLSSNAGVATYNGNTINVTLDMLFNGSSLIIQYPIMLASITRLLD
jgi:hypothetical protein